MVLNTIIIIIIITVGVSLDVSAKDVVGVGGVGVTVDDTGSGVAGGGNSSRFSGKDRCCFLESLACRFLCFLIFCSDIVIAASHVNSTSGLLRKLSTSPNSSLPFCEFKVDELSLVDY